MEDRDVERAKKFLEREAKKRSIDLDDVRVAEDVEAKGTVIRVVETDADNERDQVGFQIEMPTGPNSFQSFKMKGKEYLDALRDHLDEKRGGSSSDDADSSGDGGADGDGGTASGSEDQDVPSASSQSIPSGVQQTSGHGLSLRVGLDEDSLEELRDDLEDLLEEIDEATVGEEELTEVKEEVADINERVTAIEERLSMLAGD